MQYSPNGANQTPEISENSKPEIQKPAEQLAGVEVEKRAEHKEQPVEVKIEKRPEEPRTKVKEQPLTPVAPAPAKPMPVKTETFQAIEDIMAEDLIEVYRSMDEPTRRHFKEEGERTASKIEILLQETKLRIKKILDLIKRWLGLIPRVNRHFLEQEAKIKTDRIIVLRREKE